MSEPRKVWRLELGPLHGRVVFDPVTVSHIRYGSAAAIAEDEAVVSDERFTDKIQGTLFWNGEGYALA